jgi:hypothetical protein
MKGYAYLNKNKGDLTCTETAAKEIFSLPMYPTISNAEQDFVCETLIKILREVWLELPRPPEVFAVAICAIASGAGSAKLYLPRRNGAANGSEVLPKCWIAHFRLDYRFRRLIRDFERYAQTTIAFIRLVMVRIMLRRLGWALKKTEPDLSSLWRRDGGVSFAPKDFL